MKGRQKYDAGFKDGASGREAQSLNEFYSKGWFDGKMVAAHKKKQQEVLAQKAAADLLEAANQAAAWLQDYSLFESGVHDSAPDDAGFEHARLRRAIQEFEKQMGGK